MYFGDKILVWGNGEIGKQVVSVLQKRNKNIVGIVDKKQVEIDRDNRLYPPDLGLQLDYDQVVIAIGSDHEDEITRFVRTYQTREIDILNIMFQPEYYEIFEGGRHKFLKQYAQKAMAEGKRGSVAECGVNDGEFAKYINLYFPESDCYLFDTFEGFDARDVEVEKGFGNCAFNDSVFALKGVFSQANEKNVLKKMKYPEKVIIRKGYFPETAKGIEDKFLYVNLDMDLYQPQLAGLRFFWDKMVPGGMIMLHDYTHPNLPGVKKAVSEFVVETGEHIEVHIVDGDCSCAIFKPKR